MALAIAGSSTRLLSKGTAFGGNSIGYGAHQIMAVAEQSYPFGFKSAYKRASFTGSAREYFGIWIVNILLTIITLGIYSAWAKVRRNRYFYGNTVVLDHTFEYHAKGKQILIGRLIVFGFLAALNVLSHVAPLAAIGLWIVLIPALPWVLMRGLRFNARVTSYRNVRFDFVGTYGQACKAIYFGWLVMIISFGLATPVASRWLYCYVFNNLRYGDRPFAADPPLREFYKAFGVTFAILIGGFIATTLATGIISSIFAAPNNTVLAATRDVRIMYLGLFFYPLFYVVALLYYLATVRNIVWSSIKIDRRAELWSDLGRRQYAWIAISNVVMTFVTLGLMRPWAAVRMRRYVIEHTSIKVDGEIGVVFDQIRSTGSAMSAEYFDVDGFDFGF
jgi:uncharacterized membrane protein YjgN (DUF898 family)